MCSLPLVYMSFLGRRRAGGGGLFEDLFLCLGGRGGVGNSHLIRVRSLETV